MSDSVTRTKPCVPKRQHIVTDERHEHRQSPASPEGGSPEASPGGGWKRSAFAISRVVARVGGAHALKPPCCISTSISKLLASSTSRSGLQASSRPIHGRPTPGADTGCHRRRDQLPWPQTRARSRMEAQVGHETVWAPAPSLRIVPSHDDKGQRPARQQRCCC